MFYIYTYRNVRDISHTLTPGRPRREMCSSRYFAFVSRKPFLFGGRVTRED